MIDYVKAIKRVNQVRALSYLVAMNTHVLMTWNKFAEARDIKHYKERALWKILFFAIKMKRYMAK